MDSVYSSDQYVANHLFILPPPIEQRDMSTFSSFLRREKKRILSTRAACAVAS